jgi:formate dehydrogenase iron-sulfur subunit
VTTYAFLLDMGRCIGCQACTAACKTGNELPEGAQYIRFDEKTTGSFPQVTSRIKNQRCLHCTDAACVNVCPSGALYKEDGLTRLDRDECIRCKRCVEACPFSIPVMFKRRSSKCDGCAQVVKAGGIPWCVKTCPSNALMYGERDEVLAEAKTRLVALKKRYPNARLYGETEAGGLGVIMVLPDEAEAFDLPVAPEVTREASSRQAVAQPSGGGISGMGLLVAGLAGVISRRNQLRELQQARASADTQEDVEKWESVHS